MLARGNGGWVANNSERLSHNSPSARPCGPGRTGRSSGPVRRSEVLARGCVARAVGTRGRSSRARLAEEPPDPRRDDEPRHGLVAHEGLTPDPARLDQGAEIGGEKGPDSAPSASRTYQRVAAMVVFPRIAAAPTAGPATTKCGPPASDPSPGPSGSLRSISVPVGGKNDGPAHRAPRRAGTPPPTRVRDRHGERPGGRTAPVQAAARRRGRLGRGLRRDRPQGPGDDPGPMRPRQAVDGRGGRRPLGVPDHLPPPQGGAARRRPQRLGRRAPPAARGGPQQDRRRPPQGRDRGEVAGGGPGGGRGRPGRGPRGDRRCWSS